MNEWLLAHEPGIRLSCFLGVLLAMMAWEWQRPRRLLGVTRARRWPANLGLIAIDTVMPVSYTHLDVYKRQVLLLAVPIPGEF